jgi:hypothetical protein
MASVWSQFSPGSPPSDEMRKMRGGMLKVLAETWDEYMRTPQFMEMMKASLNGTLDLKRMAHDAILTENVQRDEFVEDYLYMETWLNDNIPVPGEVFREFANYLFQQNLLTKNRMPLGRDIVDLRKITCPLLNLMARKDDLFRAPRPNR